MPTTPTNTIDAEAEEMRRLLADIHERYGFEFQHYAPASLNRRVGDILQAEKAESIVELRQKLHDPACMERFLVGVTVHSTALFRDPGCYAALRAKVLPLLRVHPFVRIWAAGCSTGEEVYSLAILLREERPCPRSRIYATDMSEVVLAKAKAGIFPLHSMQQNTANYQRAGGRRSLSDYYTARYDHALFDPSLRENVVFAKHNLGTDGSFNEFHLVLCRNVMIYFDEVLSGRVWKLIHESLAVQGFVVLGTKESLQFSPYADCYEEIDARERIYRRVR
jgi:chemotaxis protein methyltransferase CheR